MDKKIRFFFFPCLFICFSILLSVSVLASVPDNILFLSDASKDIKLDGNTKTIYFNFDDLNPTVRQVINGTSNTYYQSGAAFINGGSSSAKVEMYFCVSGDYYIDITDLISDATVQTGYTIYSKAYESGSSVVLSIRRRIYCYDDSGTMIADLYDGYHDVTLSAGDDFVLLTDDSLLVDIPDGTKYVQPWINVICYSLPVGSGLSVYLDGFQLWTDINMIAKNTELLQGINDAINVNSGGASSDFVDKVGDQSDQLQDISGILDSVDRPDPDSVNVSIDQYVSPSDMQQVSGVLSVLFQSDLFLMMLMVLLTMSVAAYALYGKRG